ncbi:hypothetical protein RRG08_005079 [Elysia crispata]|uniref:Uncharacterized protein n=1 Tax=Elysia crispata TaxID=231223 RepID=A0AAE1CPG9_9GAST|nr:hypothetical protein RRG08_005079 [Elysia crispata]
MAECMKNQTFFGSVVCEWSEANRKHIAETGYAVGLETFAKVFQPVWQKCATKENSESSYRAAGIFLFHPQRVLESKKMDPCGVYRDVPSSATCASASSDQPPGSELDQKPEPPAPFEYESGEERPESSAPFDEEPASQHPTPTSQLPISASSVS